MICIYLCLFSILFHYFFVNHLIDIQAFTHHDANDYIERVLENRFLEEAKYSRLDPYKLDDIKVPLNYSYRQNGSATLWNGKIINLSKVRRSADCTVPRYQSANVTFTCFLRFDHLRINYTANATFDNMELMFYPHVAIRGTNFTIQVTSAVQEDIPNLRMMFINHIGNINVTAQMISIGDTSEKIGPFIHTALVENSTRYLHRILNGRFRDALAYSIYKTPVIFASFSET